MVKFISDGKYDHNIIILHFRFLQSNLKINIGHISLHQL